MRALVTIGEYRLFRFLATVTGITDILPLWKEWSIAYHCRRNDRYLTTVTGMVDILPLWREWPISYYRDRNGRYLTTVTGMVDILPLWQEWPISYYHDRNGRPIPYHCHRNDRYLTTVRGMVDILLLWQEWSISYHCHRNDRYLTTVTGMVDILPLWREWPISYYRDRNDFHISIESWESLASDRPCWRRIVTQGAITAEEHRTLQAEQKRAARKAKTTSTVSTLTHNCLICGKKLPCPDWPHQPPSDTPQQPYWLIMLMVIFDNEGRTTLFWAWRLCRYTSVQIWATAIRTRVFINCRLHA